MLDIRKFFQSTNPSKVLNIGIEEDRKFYIDFSSVRGGQIIEELKDNITFFSPDVPTCNLFTGHIGCGKSTELLRLKRELEAEDFHVVYFESSEDLEMADVDIGDVLLAIARRVSQSLDQMTIAEPKGLRELLKGAAKLLQTEFEVTDVEVGLPEGLGMEGLKFSANNEGEFSLALGIGKITTRAKNDSTLRERLNQYLGPQKTKLLESINRELLEPAIAKLKEQGKRGLVVIMDNLDRVDSSQKPFGRPQQEYLFIDQSECLMKLGCHMVYTMPLALKFSSEYGRLTQRFSQDARVLPMVPVQYADGSECTEGLALLRQMVLSRAFPHLNDAERMATLTEVFETQDALDRLCRTSGGHVRDLLRLLNDWIKRGGRHLPLAEEKLEAVIRAQRNEMRLQISDDEWELLRQVRQRKTVGGYEGYQTLIHSRLVFEYRDRGESWFDVNPILADAKELQS